AGDGIEDIFTGLAAGIGDDNPGATTIFLINRAADEASELELCQRAGHDAGLDVEIGCKTRRGHIPGIEDLETEHPQHDELAIADPAVWRHDVAETVGPEAVLGQDDHHASGKALSVDISHRADTSG